MRLKEEIKSQLLNNKTDEHDIYKGVCESLGFEEEPTNLYDDFKATYNAVIESDWWERVQREQRMNEYLEEHDRTDEREFNLEKSRMVRKYG